MTFSFEITEAEFRESMSQLRRDPGGDWYKPIRWAALVGGAIGIAMTLGGGWRMLILVSPLLLLSFFVVGYPIAAMRDAVGDAWDTYKAAAGLVTWEFTEESATMQNSCVTVRYQWRAFIRFAETRNLFLLYRTHDQPVMISKRVILESASVEPFRALLQAKIPGRALGFTVAVKAKSDDASL